MDFELTLKFCLSRGCAAMPARRWWRGRVYPKGALEPCYECTGGTRDEARRVALEWCRTRGAHSVREAAT